MSRTSADFLNSGISSKTTLAMWKAIDRVLQKLDALEKRVEEVEKELEEIKEVK